MWDELKRQAGGFSRTVLNARDADGYPASVRTSFVFDDAERIVRVDVPAGVALQEGVASLLFHGHNEQLWDLRIASVRGELARVDDGWVLRPVKLVEDASGALAIVRMLRNCRKTAKTYLAKRGLARPAIPWAHLKELKGKA
jgi:hypothetical protein